MVIVTKICQQAIVQLNKHVLVCLTYNIQYVMAILFLIYSKLGCKIQDQ